MVSGLARQPVVAEPCWQHADVRAGRVSAPDHQASKSDTPLSADNRAPTTEPPDPAGLTAPARLSRRQEGQASDVGFPRSKRLLQPGDYSSVFSNNVRVSNHYWTILAAKGQGEQARLGLAIAKKRAKRAVDRNRFKRIIRESFRRQGNKLGHIDIVVMNRDACVGATSAELRRSLESLWKKLAVKCKTLS